MIFFTHITPFVFVENRRIIGMKIIDISKRVNIKVLMWKIYIKTH